MFFSKRGSMLLSSVSMICSADISCLERYLKSLAETVLVLSKL